MAGDRRPARADRRAARARRTSGRPARPGPCGPCCELYLDRGLEFGKADDLPGGDNERFLEYWNLVFMQYDQEPRNTLDAAAGAEHRHRPRASTAWRAILQGVPSVFETDQFRPLIELARSCRGRRYGARPRDRPRAARSSPTTRAACRFLIADGVVPSNEDRGYVAAPPDAPRDRPGPPARHRAGVPRRATPSVVRELMGGAYPELLEQADTIDMWLRREEESVRPHARAGPADARRA